jgi:hypothetical protein
MIKVNLVLILAEDFLFRVEKEWPVDNYIWSQEVVLEILADFNYDTNITFDFIKQRNKNFMEILESKLLNLTQKNYSIVIIIRIV